jgi:serine/threonine-protein kinase
VIHRDIKPENILLQEGQAVVADFGIARALRAAGGERLTETGLSLGTPHYMSPEQASGTQELDARTDIYALGCVLYEMLAGDPPFTGPTGQAVIARQLVDPVPSLRTVRPTVPEELERAIEMALAKVSADRYETAGAFVEAAGAAAQIVVVPTRERRALERDRRRVSPRARRVGAAVALAAAAAITTGVLLLTSDRLGREPPLFTVSNSRQVTRALEVEWDPAISPDGREVVYTAGLGFDMHIFVRDLSGGRSLPLTADRPGTQVFPRWTPDGRSIVFRESGTETGAYLIPRFGGAARAIGTRPVWATHGDRVVYIRRDSLLVRSIEGGEETFVAWAPSQPHSVAWSPDGTKLAYVQGNADWNTLGLLGNFAPSSIWLVSVDGGELVQVTDDTNLNVSPAWMPDGQHLLFISNRDGPRDVYAVQVDASGRPRGQSVRVTTGLDPHSISVSTDGSTVAYSQFTFRQNIWEIAIPETGSVSISEARPVTVGNQIVEAHGLSRDGRWLAFNSNLEGNQDIYVMTAEGGEPRQVTRDPADDFHPDFSPDRSEIVFHSTRHGTRDVFLISADGRDVRRLTDGPADDYNPSFSPDGLRIAFHRSAGVRNDIYVMSRDSLGGEWTAPESLTPDTGVRSAPRWSPDGSQIACFGGLAIRIVSLHREERILFDAAAAGFRRADWPDWSADGRFIYFTAIDSTGARNLYVIPAAGGIPQEVVRFDDPTKNVSWVPFTLGDDKVYFSMREVESDIYVMDLEMR